MKSDGGAPNSRPQAAVACFSVKPIPETTHDPDYDNSSDGGAIEVTAREARSLGQREQYLTLEQVAARYGYTSRTSVYGMMKRPGFPPPFRLWAKGHPRWSIADLDAFDNAQRNTEVFQ